MAGCNHECKQHPNAVSLKGINRQFGLYAQGLRSCTTCGTWFRNQIRCPCCHMPLRWKARYSALDRKQYLERKNKELENKLNDLKQFKNDLLNENKNKNKNKNKNNFYGYNDVGYVVKAIDWGYNNWRYL
jgi:hypothetical protein